MNGNGQIWENTELDHYVMCVNGVVSDPIPVPEGSVCFNNHFVRDGSVHCDASIEECSGHAVQCVNGYGSPVSNACTAYYRTCADHKTTGPLSPPEGYTCYNGAFVPQTLCPAFDTSSCSFCRNRCVNDDGVAEYAACTHRYVTCVNGTVSSPQEVPSGSGCFKGNIIPAGFCPLSPHCTGCPAGEEGPEGPKGEPGITGAAGEPGPTGPVGPEGPTGAPGEEGEPRDPRVRLALWGRLDRGDRGAREGRRARRAQRERRARGAPWVPRGEPGEEGPQGPTGEAGGRGATGATGGEGPAGPAGRHGNHGRHGRHWSPRAVREPRVRKEVWEPRALLEPRRHGYHGRHGRAGSGGCHGWRGCHGSVGAPGTEGSIENEAFFETVAGATRFLLDSRVDNLADTATTSNLVVYRKMSSLFDGMNVELTFDLTWGFMGRREYQYLCSSNPGVITTTAWPCTADSCPSVVSVSYGMNMCGGIRRRGRKRNVRR